MSEKNIIKVKKILVVGLGLIGASLCRDLKKKSKYEKIYGYEKMLEYLVYQRDFINGGSPILGHRDVNKEGNSIDMYYKGSWMLHSIRNTVSNDSLWFSIIKGLAQKFEKGSCDGSDVVNYICNKSCLLYTSPSPRDRG